MLDAQSLDDSVRSGQHVPRNCQTDLLGGLQIYDQLELSWLLHRKVSGLMLLKDLVHICSGPTIKVGEIRPIRREATTLDGST